MRANTMPLVERPTSQHRKYEDVEGGGGNDIMRTASSIIRGIGDDRCGALPDGPFPLTLTRPNDFSVLVHNRPTDPTNKWFKKQKKKTEGDEVTPSEVCLSVSVPDVTLVVPRTFS